VGQILVSCSAPEAESGTGASQAPESSAPADGSAAGPERINLGIAAGRRQGQTPIDALHDTEQVASRRFDTLRAYAFWDGEFPDLRHQLASEGDRMLHLSINARRTDGSIVPWQVIATASEGDVVHGELVAWIERLANHEAHLRVTFHHESDIEPEFGSPEDFVEAWRRFATMLDEAAPEIETVWVLTGFNLDKPIADEFWPGDEYVDFIGADAFNWYGCRGVPEAWRSPAEVIAPLLKFATKHPDKRLVLAELGSDEDAEDPGRKAAWFDELATLLTSNDYAQLDTVVFFHNDHDDDSTCDWWLDSSDASADAFERLAALPLFGGDVAPAATLQCPIVAMGVSLVEDLALVDGDGDGRFDFEFGDTNRFLGIGDQSNDGADHRLLLQFDALPALSSEATLELRIRIGERQPALTGDIDLYLLDDFDRAGEAFAQPGVLLEPALFTASSPGGHHVIDVTGRVDPGQPSAFRLQLAAPPPTGDGQSALYIGMGDASRSIDRPTLVARLCD